MPSMEKPVTDLGSKIEETQESNKTERQYTFPTPPPKPILPQNIQGGFKLL
mgnify:CR=1 FL=1